MLVLFAESGKLTPASMPTIHQMPNRKSIISMASRFDKVLASLHIDTWKTRCQTMRICAELILQLASQSLEARVSNA